MILEVGKTYTNKNKIRKIIKIENNEVYYETNKNQKKCWITTFEDWVKKGEKNKKIKLWQVLKVFTESKNPNLIKANLLTKIKDTSYNYEYISMIDGVFYWNNDLKKPFKINDFYNILSYEWEMENK